MAADITFPICPIHALFYNGDTWVLYAIGFGLELYKPNEATTILAIGLPIFFAQWVFSRYWLERHKQGTLDYLWRQGTWVKI